MPLFGLKGVSKGTYITKKKGTRALLGVPGGVFVFAGPSEHPRPSTPSAELRSEGGDIGARGQDSAQGMIRGFRV